MKTLVSALAVASLAGAAFGLEVEKPAAAHGWLEYNVATGQQTWRVAPSDTVDRNIDALTAYSSVNNFYTSVYGVSSTDLTQSWGDLVNNALSGTLEEYTFTVYVSSSSNTKPLNGFNLSTSFQNGNTAAALGTIGGFIDLSGSPLPAGSFTFLTFTGLSSAGVNLPMGATFIKNTISGTVFGAGTGTPRMGTTFIGGAAPVPVFPDAPGVGSSANGFYIDASTIGGGVPGFYTFGGVNGANLQLETKIPAPGAAALLGLAGVVGLRRRR